MSVRNEWCILPSTNLQVQGTHTGGDHIWLQVHEQGWISGGHSEERRAKRACTAKKEALPLPLPPLAASIRFCEG